MARKSKIDASTKDKIVQAAIRCYIEQGVAQTRLNDIAKAAKLAPPHLHYYFKDPADLQRAVILEVLKSLKDASLAGAKETATFREEFESYVRAPFLWAKENPGLATIWLYFYHLCSFDPEMRKLNDQIRETGRERILLFIFKGVREGVFKPREKHLTIEDLALSIQGLITGNSVIAFSEGKLQTEKIQSTTLSTIYELVNAIFETA